MNRVATRVAAGIVVVSFTLTSGCSAVLVRPPKRDRSGQLQPGRCTASKAAPVVDLLIAAAGIFGAGLAFNRTDSDYQDSTSTRSADIVGGIVTMGLFGLSAAYGFASISSCRRLRASATGAQQRGPGRQAPTSPPSEDEEEDDEEDEDDPSGAP